ncbi:MAG TPA: hypothetical protein DIU15_14385, partial [Deltaproteobacteria bacterium]|nr:hypothetical protein [Deltaproteobacteria bacterium]
MRRRAPLHAHLAIFSAAAMTALGCQPQGSEPTVAVVSELYFASEEPSGVSVGFDLDERTSDENDTGGCGIPDLQDPEGRAGIDNSFASVLPALELTEGVAVQALIQAAVNSGELLLMFEMDGLETWTPGACVGLSVLRGTGEPKLGSNDRLLGGQTYDRNLDAPHHAIDCAEITGATLEGSPFEYRLPLQIFDEYIDLTLLDGVIEIDMLGIGEYRGRFGGGVSVQEVKDNMAMIDGVGDEVRSLIDTVLNTRADLQP